MTPMVEPEVSPEEFPPSPSQQPRRPRARVFSQPQFPPLWTRSPLKPPSLKSSSRTSSSGRSLPGRLRKSTASSGRSRSPRVTSSSATSTSTARTSTRARQVATSGSWSSSKWRMPAGRTWRAGTSWWWRRRPPDLNTSLGCWLAGLSPAV